MPFNEKEDIKLIHDIPNSRINIKCITLKSEQIRNTILMNFNNLRQNKLLGEWQNVNVAADLVKDSRLRRKMLLPHYIDLKKRGFQIKLRDDYFLLNQHKITYSLVQQQFINSTTLNNAKVELNNEKAQQDNLLRIINWNCQGLGKKIKSNNLAYLLNNNHIIGITETWITNPNIKWDNNNDQLNIFLTTARKPDGPGRPYGGLCLLIKKNIGEIKFKQETDNYIMVLLQVTNSTITLLFKKHLIILLIYVPPEQPETMKKIFDQYEKWKHISPYTIIIGDMNARIAQLMDTIYYGPNTLINNTRESKDKKYNKVGLQLLDHTHRLQLYIMNGRLRFDYPSEFTCINYNGCSVIDLTICSELMSDLCASIQVLNCDMSDHFPTCTSFEISNKTTTKKEPLFHQTIYYDYQAYLSQISEYIKNTMISEENNGNEKYLQLSKKINYFKNLQHKLISTKNTDFFWTTIQRLRRKKLDYRINIETSTWNKFFNRFPNIIRPPSPNSFIPNNDLFDLPFTSDELEDSIRKLKLKSAPGMDLITSRFIKALPPSGKQILLDSFNFFYKTSKYPENWNTAKLIMIYKKGNRLEPENYRPIALLPVLRKCFTSILVIRFQRWTQEINLNSKFQYAFTKSRGTEFAIFLLSSIIQIYLQKKRRKIYAAFIDISKAFDSVHVPTLVNKLKQCGAGSCFSGSIMNLFSFYKLYIVNDKVNNPEIITNRGLLQGEPLSPYLFNFYINDINNLFDKDNEGIYINGRTFHHIMYADDLVLLAPTRITLQHKIDKATVKPELHFELLKICQYTFSIPAHNAITERALCLVEPQWTDQRNRMEIETVKSLVMMKFNINNRNCLEFYDEI
ncbi:uncharacterized protein [Centruroides vittatus]|uniref:uncharacterized protein n=1 Tax=Centruroides vittatus TaxID=120091 RepID=UPI0035107041